MPKAFIGDKGYKLILGNTKIRRGYLGNVMVYSGDINVTYHILDNTGLVYEEAVEEGLSCLDPQSFEPAGLRPGYTFLGWRSDKEAVSDVYEELIAGSDNLDLYAVYYKDFTVNFYNGSTNYYTHQYRMYSNNEVDNYPYTGTEETTLVDVSGYRNKLGWTYILNETVQRYANGSPIQIKSDISLYSVYSENSSITIINGSNDGPVKSSYASIRYRQYNDNVYTINPSYNLVHNTVTGYDNYGWNITLNDVIKTIEDGVLVITSNYDNQTIYALYSEPVYITVVNGSNSGPVKSILLLYRYFQYNTIKYIKHPSYKFVLNAVSNWNKYGWNKTESQSGREYNDNVTIDIDYNLQDKTFYGLYYRDTTFTVYNGNNNGSAKTVYTPRYYLQYGSAARQFNPTIQLSHNSVSGWTNNGWNTTRGNTSRKDYNDGTFTMQPSLDNKSLYALYTQAVKVTVYNGSNNNVPVSNTYNLTRYRQYADIISTTNPTLSLSHNNVTGWANNGWNMANNSTPAFYDGNKEIVSSMDNGSIYALYKQTVTFKTIDVNNNRVGAVTTWTKDRYKQFRNTIVVYHPTIYLTHTNTIGKTINGWNFGEAANVVKFNDGTITLDTNYDNKVAYALYKENITINWYENSPTPTPETKVKYMKVTQTVIDIISPTFSRNVKAFGNWDILGWTTSSSYVYSASYASGATFAAPYSMSLFSAYKKLITLTSNSKGTIAINFGYGYYNRGTGSSASAEYPTFTISNPSDSGKTFLGWSLTSGSTTVWKSNISNLQLTDSTAIFAIWKVHDVVLEDWTREPDGYKRYLARTPGTGEYQWRIYEHFTNGPGGSETIDTYFYNEIKYDIKAFIHIANFQSAHWAIWALFSGIRPNYNAGEQPWHQTARAMNIQFGNIVTDEGPCAYEKNEGRSTRAIVTNRLDPTPGYGTGARVSIALYGDWYDIGGGTGENNSCIYVYKIWITGKTVTW